MPATPISNPTLIEATARFVKKELERAEGGHDWFHIERVWKNTRLLLQTETHADPEIAQLGALLHDIADSKFHGGNEDIGPEIAATFLRSRRMEEEMVQRVVFIVRNISFKGGHGIKENLTPELQIVQDADRLDAIGAIGIARAFHYGGFKDRRLYDPEIPPNLQMSREAYKSSSSPTLNHFYEKLLLLKDQMHTATARKLAEERHRYLEGFLDQFLKEWDPV
jgi:uncharacterized protein